MGQVQRASRERHGRMHRQAESHTGQVQKARRETRRAGAKGMTRKTQGRCKGQAWRDKRQAQRASRLQQAGNLTWKGPEKASAAGSNCSAVEWMRNRS